MTVAARLAVVGVAVAIVGPTAVAGCGDSGNGDGDGPEVAADGGDGGDSVTEDGGGVTGGGAEPAGSGEGEPINKPQVCFEAEGLQHLGGKHLAALDAADAEPAVYMKELEEIVDGSFAPTLNNRLYELRASGDPAGEAVDDAAQRALDRVRERPGLLLDEDRLAATFADAQAAAADAGFSWPDCGG